MSGNVAPSPVFHWSLSTGAPAVGYKLYTYSTGTTTPRDTFSASSLAGGTENTNPIVLDVNGNALIYLSPVAYKFILKTDADVLVETWDPVTGIGLSTDITSIDARVAVLEALSIATLTGSQTLTNKTLTSPIVNTPTGTLKTEVVAATNVITAAESGSVFFLNSATEFVSTLPAVAAGLHFTFIVTAAPSGASYTVVGASGTPIKGHVLTNDVNSATDADFGTAGELTLTFVDGKAVAGDRAEFWCDGTNWFVVASCSVFDAITLA
jgi:hypothetical protein